MRKPDFWRTLSLANLCLLALFGLLLRTKFLFPIPWMDYRNLLSAHSHFAFGGWVTLALMILYIDKLLTDEQKQNRIYYFLLAGINITSLGMLFTFPFTGYALFSIIFSTTYIFITYVFCWVFIRDMIRTQNQKPVKILSIGSAVSLAISSIGPFYLAYMMATKTGTYFQNRDAVYTFLHFQYNGFFTLSVLALFFADKYREASEATREKITQFAILLCLSVIPSLFLSLLWHSYNIDYIRTIAYVGCALILLSIISFSRLLPGMGKHLGQGNSIARTLLVFAIISFFIKMILQTGTIVPWLAHAVFGFRPVIIGFLHLVFLGLVTFYILSRYVEDGFLPVNRKATRAAVIYFSAGILIHEVILLINGIGLLMLKTSPLYGWLMWIAAILLFTGAVVVYFSRRKVLE